jgi:hypothetical protein
MRIGMACLFAFGSVSAFAGETCQPLLFPESAALVSSDTGNQQWSYSLRSGDIGGDAASDELVLELYSAGQGSFDLGDGINDNYASCAQCVLLYQDLDGSTPKVFFQEAGTLEINGAVGSDPLPVLFSGVRLVEVTIDPNTFESTPVPNGDCYIGIEDQIFSSGFDG